MQQVRLTKTPEIDKVLSFLREKYRLLSETEIIKVALSEKYNNEVEKDQDAKFVLELAQTAGVDYIVTRDKDLKVLIYLLASLSLWRSGFAKN